MRANSATSDTLVAQGRQSISEASRRRSLICIISKFVHNFRGSLPSGDGLNLSEVSCSVLIPGRRCPNSPD